MFERFTDRARKVMAMANQAATSRKHDYLGGEHILLGLIAEGESVAVQAIVNLGLKLEVVQKSVEQVMAMPSGDVLARISPRHKVDNPNIILESAEIAAQELGNDYIGAEHLLLGLLAENDGIAAQALIAEGARIDLARTAAREAILTIHERSRGETIILPLHKMPEYFGLRLNSDRLEELSEYTKRYVDPEMPVGIFDWNTALKNPAAYFASMPQLLKTWLVATASKSKRPYEGFLSMLPKSLSEHLYRPPNKHLSNINVLTILLRDLNINAAPSPPPPGRPHPGKGQMQR